MVHFQIPKDEPFSSKMIDFLIGNGPQNRDFLSKMVDLSPDNTGIFEKLPVVPVESLPVVEKVKYRYF